MLWTAYKTNEGPVAVRYPRGNALAPDAKAPFQLIPVGIPKVVQEGDDLLILAAGHMLAYARKAAEALAQDGIRPTVADARFVKPLDKDAYAALFARHRAVLTLEDNVIPGGYGEAVALVISEIGRSDLPIRHIGLPDEFVTHGDIPTLHRILGMDADGIRKKAVELMAQVNLGSPLNSQLQPKSR